MPSGPPIATSSLRRTLALRTVVSTSAGLTFASSTFLVVVTIACSLMGDAAWIPILIAGALCALAAAAFSELNSLYPTVAGIRRWIQEAFGEKAALVAALTYMSVVTLVVGTEAYVLSYVLNAAMPAIAPPLWVFLMLTLATAANFRGLKVAGALQDIITYMVVISIVSLSLLALNQVHFQVPEPFHPGSPDRVFAAVGLAIFLFVGFEWVTPLAEEVKEKSFIARGMFLAVGLLTAVYALLALAMFAGPDRHALFGTAAHRQPIPHLLFATRALGFPGRVCMIVTSLCMSLTTFNAGLMSVSRFLYSCARDHVLPKSLGYISERYATPYSAVLTVYGIALIVSFVVFFTGKYVLLVNLAAGAESLIFAMAGACVVALRLRERKQASGTNCERPAAALAVETSRPYRMWGGLLLPGLLTLVFAAIGLGVFLTPGWESGGAGLLLLLIGLGWWLYVQFNAMPRIRRTREMQAARRQSRRPIRSEGRE